VVGSATRQLLKGSVKAYLSMVDAASCTVRETGSRWSNLVEEVRSGRNVRESATPGGKTAERQGPETAESRMEDVEHRREKKQQKERIRKESEA